MDYENVMNKEEEELHYSSLVNLASRSHPINVDLETDSQSEDSIQYAALRHWSSQVCRDQDSPTGEGIRIGRVYSFLFTTKNSRLLQVKEGS